MQRETRMLPRAQYLVARDEKVHGAAKFSERVVVPAFQVLGFDNAAFFQQVFFSVTAGLHETPPMRVAILQS